MLQPELKFRRDKIRSLMVSQGIDAALITCNANLIYTYGCVVSGFFITASIASVLSWLFSDMVTPKRWLLIESVYAVGLHSIDVFSRLLKRSGWRCVEFDFIGCMGSHLRRSEDLAQPFYISVDRFIVKPDTRTITRTIRKR
jgi:hypothetical protein